MNLNANEANVCTVNAQLIIKTSPLRLLSVEIFSNDVYVVVPKPAIEMSIISKDIDCIMSSIKKQKFN